MAMKRDADTPVWVKLTHCEPKRVAGLLLRLAGSRSARQNERFSKLKLTSISGSRRSETLLLYLVTCAATASASFPTSGVSMSSPSALALAVKISCVTAAGFPAVCSLYSRLTSFLALIALERAAASWAEAAALAADPAADIMPPVTL